MIDIYLYGSKSLHIGIKFYNILVKLFSKEVYLILIKTLIDIIGGKIIRNFLCL